MSDNGQFRIEVVEDGEKRHLSLIGELDLAVNDEAWEALRPMVKPGSDLLLDLSRITFIDSRGLSVLVRAINALEGGSLVLRGTSPLVVRLLDISGLRELVTLE